MPTGLRLPCSIARGGAGGVLTATTGRLIIAAGGRTDTGRPAPITLVRIGSARDQVTNRRGCDLRWIHSHHVPGHRPRIHERVMRHHRHAVVHVLIHIRDVVDVVLRLTITVL